MNTNSCTMIIFGATGDLTLRKLIPAIHQLKWGGYLPEDFNLVAIGRKPKDDAEYRENLLDGMKTLTNILVEQSTWDYISERIHYFKMDFSEDGEYERLHAYLEKNKKENNFSSNYLFYLAVAPDKFGFIVKNLKEKNISSENGNWSRLVIEKPFGENLQTAYDLNDEIAKAFNEENIYRIDHYLAKEMIQNITMLRFQNTIFEPLWRNTYIDNIQISVLEKDGVGSRGGYYDQTGALRDMVQNHLLQTLAITAMEPPASLGADDMRDSKVKLMSELVLFDPGKSKTDVIFGQYEGYHNETGIAEDSETETFAALKLFIDNPRWKGVPFYLVTGKKLSEKSAQVTIQFKNPAVCNASGKSNPIYELTPNSCANILEIKIQPREGIHLRLNTKKPAVEDQSVVAEMEYCQSCQYSFNTPDAYEKLILDVIKGDSTRFTRWDELALSWYFIDSIDKKSVPLVSYKDESEGPQEADLLLKRDDRTWWFKEKIKRGES
ncbi:glucose-6-phosphate dehydrogenase [Alkalibacter saccharofermentans]|uniref:Glucose-6-phosphate 1-dehydrogenase n=1 Tax=Alkalibacter saccharofermentans DSM 14828 TaxID=1120975 RepID=A0A1M4SAC1_9FIRM|nr:glucose-6-phosphate dehydrogenase [Alkalibacter saccharofermentans]SHE29156.1 glucose-6-phosphate 1-dehydrogenase [Alkalibacter saccharofermentans DSM 14828]